MTELDSSLDDLGAEVFIMYDGDTCPGKYIEEWGYAGMDTPNQTYHDGFECSEVRLRIDLNGKSYDIQLPTQLERDLMDLIESQLDDR